MEDQLNQIWLTYKARFNAQSRLSLKYKLEKSIMAILSAYILMLNILVFLPDSFIKPQNQNYIAFYTICLSIVLIALNSIIDYSATEKKANKFHDCALELKALYDKLQFIKFSETSFDILYSEYTNYHEILKKFDINHDFYDACMVKHQKRDEFKINLFSYYKFYTKYFFKFYSLYILLLATPILSGIIIVVYK